MLASWKMLCAIAFLLSSTTYVSSQQAMDDDYSTANLSTLWINPVSTDILNYRTIQFRDESTIVRPIFLRVIRGEQDSFYRLAYGCGFYCNGTCESYVFAISIFIVLDDFDYENICAESPQLVWSANRNNPVGENASLELTSGGNLVLRDAKRAFVWSTDTSGKAVAGLNLTEMGNLILFDTNNTVVWQSFDHPTDCLLAGQHLRIGQNLRAAASPCPFSAFFLKSDSKYLSSSGLDRSKIFLRVTISRTTTPKL